LIDNTQDRRIDFVFVHGLDVKRYAHLDVKTPAGRWISDHFPVMATLDMRVGDRN
jgi:endonuclease/exonuclease/phosphatase family metal-dependent hydrolase